MSLPIGLYLVCLVVCRWALMASSRIRQDFDGLNNEMANLNLEDLSRYSFSLSVRDNTMNNVI